MERLRSIEIIVDTNKMTYTKKFVDVEEMFKWLASLDLGILQNTNDEDGKEIQ